MTRISLVLLSALALCACDPASPTAPSGRTDQRLISRTGDGGRALYANAVPGGCLYHSYTAMTFAPFPCPPDAGR